MCYILKDLDIDSGQCFVDIAAHYLVVNDNVLIAPYGINA